VDLTKLSNGDKLLAASGIALLIFSFFKWFSAEIPDAPLFAGQSDSAWGFTLGIIAVLLGVVTAALAVLPAFGVELPPVLTAKRTVLTLAVLVFLGIVLLVFTAGYEVQGLPDDAVDTKKEIGAWLGLIASIGILAGGILKYKEGAPATPPAAPPTA
jgi:hypothetical protein